MGEIFDKGDWITEEAAVESSRRGLLVSRDPAMARASHDAEPSAPLLVERLDKPGVAYYLVPWMIETRTAIAVQVDALTGVNLGITLFSKETPAPFLKPEDALARVAREFPGRELGKPKLVWQPCRESTSPVYPFFEVRLDSRNVYVRMDGSIFQKLTPLGLGG